MLKRVCHGQLHHRTANIGHSLSEMLVALAITGLLASLGYPAYQAQVQKSRRIDAMQALWKLQQAQERFRANHPIYSDSLEELGQAQTLTSGGHYVLSLAGTPSSTSYSATATAVGGQTQDGACSVLVLAMIRGTVLQSPSACWAR